MSLHKPPDTISTLVHVYGSRELFAKEYTAMLAERLLALTGTANSLTLLN